MNNEITKLVILLAKADIPFELYPWICNGEATLQIATPTKADCKIDAVSHRYSYGGNDGLLEILTDALEDVVGWLSAEQAFEYFKQIMDNN